MNSQEVKISRKLAGMIPEEGVCLFNVKIHQQTRLILILLKGLVDIAKKRGIVITLEKPHHYLTYLLGIHGVSQRYITYVDLAASSKKSVNFPLKVGLESSVSGFIRASKVDPKDYGFILVDNLGHSKIFLSEKTMESFVRYLIRVAEQKNICLLIPLDMEKCPTIYEMVKKKARYKISMEEVIKIAD